ncbi:hypothetical protein PRNP1_006847 [Phytophthora ramorum]
MEVEYLRDVAEARNTQLLEAEAAQLRNTETNLQDSEQTVGTKRVEMVELWQIDQCAAHLSSLQSQVEAMKADKKKMESAAAALESDCQAGIQEASAVTKELLRRDAEIGALKIERDMIKEEATAWKTRWWPWRGYKSNA